jgi:hypothetical protein
MSSHVFRRPIFSAAALSALAIFLMEACTRSAPESVQSAASASPAPADPANAGLRVSRGAQLPIHFTVRDGIGNDQISEVITVYVAGVALPTIYVSQEQSESVVPGTVPAEGQYEYRVSGVLTRVADNTHQTLRLVGAGTVVIRRGSRLSLSLPESSPTHGIVALTALSR